MNWKTFCAAVVVLSSALEIGLSQTISSFSPGFGTNSQPLIGITGTGFHPGTLVVKFNNVVATAQATQSTQIYATVPATATTGPISVQVNGGPVINSAEDFIVISQAPYITEFPPTGAVGTTIIIKGVNFSGASSVKFNGLAASFNMTVVNQINAVVPPNVTTGPISVTTSKGTGTSVSNFFAAPVVTSFSPATARAGTNVILTGKNFIGTTVVKINAVAVPSFTVDSNTQITMPIPPSATTGPISVTAPANQFISTSNLVVLPTIISFSPYFGRPGTNVTIIGANFTGATSVSFNGSVVSPSGVTANQLTAIVPAAATSGPITVMTPTGSATSSTNFFLPPTISGFTPFNGAVGTNVTITGVNFTNATDVSFNNVSASFNVVNNGVISATVPPSAMSGPISVTTPGGTTNSGNGFFHVRPSVTGFNPGSGLAGDLITITGTSLTNATAIKFNGADAASFFVIDNTQATAVVPTNATTGPISVVAPAGTAVSATDFVIDIHALNIRLLTNNVVSISWPTNANGFVLQAITNLNQATNGSTNWYPVTNLPFIQNGKNTITNSITNSPRFYRLKK